MDISSTTASDSSPKFPSKEWFLKNKVLVGIVVIAVLLGTGVGIYFAVRPKDGGGTGGGGTGGGTDVGARKNGKWSEWSTECIKQGDQWVKTRTCLEEGKNGGLLCSQIDGGKTIQICEAIPGGWRTPDDSDAVCKLENGKWVKERFCDAPAPKYGGATCSGSNKVECTPVAGGWRTPPDSDAVCKLEDGKWMKERFCDAPVPKYGATCSGSNKVECTPLNGRWKTNFSDEICKVETDAQNKPIVDANGRTSYYKTIICENPKYGGAPCPTRTETGVEVSGDKARIKCLSTDGVWTNFSTCETQGSNSVKTRTCTLATHGGLPCVADYPLVNLVENDDSGYIVSASSTDPGLSTYKPASAFDGNINTMWHSHDSNNSNRYDAFDGTYKGAIITTAENNTTYRGEWIQIKFPPSTIHTLFQAIGIKITPRQDSGLWARRSPRNFVLLGSELGSKWTVIYDNTLLDGIKDWTQSTKTLYFPIPASKGYTFYRLVVTRVGNDCPDQKEVFQVRSNGITYNLTRTEADAVCTKYGATIATPEQLQTDFNAGADWCSFGWLSDNTMRFPINTTLIQGCSTVPKVQQGVSGNGKADVNCYGIKPNKPQGTDYIHPFNQTFYGKPCDRKSVQIAELRIIGTPFITPNSDPTEPVLQTTEKIPCDADCRLNDWQPACVKEGNDWKQNRTVSSQPVGAGKACSTDLKRNCPGTATNWSAWGAFARNQTTYGKPSSKENLTKEFSIGNTYDTGNKQVAYVELADNQGCSSDTTEYDSTNRICYKTRNVWGEWGSCELSSPNGRWQRKRTATTGQTQLEDCNPVGEWKDLPDYPFRIHMLADSGFRVDWSGNKRNNRDDQPQKKFVLKWPDADGDPNRQLFIRDSQNKWAFPPVHCGVGSTHHECEIADALGYNTDSARLQGYQRIKGNIESRDYRFFYNPTTHQIRPEGNPNRCLNIMGYNYDAEIGFRDCDVNNDGQRFKIFPA